MSVIHFTNHGLAVGQAIKFANIVPTDTGIDETATYYVIAANLTANDFSFSDTLGGAEFDIAFDITEGDVYAPEEYTLLPVTEEPDAKVWGTVSDMQAPGVPVEVVLTAGVLGFLARWAGTTAADLTFYEFRYAPDNGTGTAPDTELWKTARSKANALWVGGLTNILYWFQVRAIDSSGNVVTSLTDDTPVKYTEDSEAGFSAALSVTPLLTDSADIAEGAVGTSHISIGGLDAGVIRAGYLRVAVSDATAIDGIQVYNGSALVGFWNETGLYVYSSTDSTDYVRVYEGGISVFLDGSEVAALSPAGVNASAITSGTLPGGGNIVKNSSFELADFSVPTTVTAVWTLDADWDATIVGTDTNITENAGSRSMTGTTY